MDISQFISDAQHATHRQGIDATPVCYMGWTTFLALMTSMNCPPGSRDVEVREVNGVPVYIVRKPDDHYHMTFRRVR